MFQGFLRQTIFSASSIVIVMSLLIAMPLAAHAQILPGPADIDRAVPPSTDLYEQPRIPVDLPKTTDKDIRFSAPPANAAQIQFQLSGLIIQGVTAYSADEMKGLYQEYVGQTVTLDQVWKISDKITQKYRQDGYFLSRAYIPAQEIDDGKIIIKVVEGYIAEVEIDDTLKRYASVQKIIQDITTQRPVSAKVLERNHLLLTDLAGLQNLHGTLDVLENSKDGGVKLVYSKKDGPTSSAFIGVDNFGSRFLGPVQALAVWKGNLVNLHETSIAARSSLPLNELQNINVVHAIPLTSALSVSLSGGYAHAEPGYTLAPQEIESRSMDIGVTFDYKIIRQRQENLSVNMGVNGRNSKSTILNTTTLSEDKVRAARVGAVYDKVDPTGGYNRFDVSVSQGINGLGSSQKNDLNLSRDGAEPDFTKLEIEYTHYHLLPYDFSAILTASGQKASGSLYSSEEFGFGGQSMGRAYDSSEISGDDGIAGSLELQYDGLPDNNEYKAQPYIFYDIGKVWNDNAGQPTGISASSAGLGTRFQHISGLSGTLQLSVPLTKEIGAPSTGKDPKGPQVDFQLGYRF